MSNTNNIKDRNVLQQLESLNRLHNDLMRQYNKLVLPWDLGYNMPEETSKEATELLEHASNIREKIEKVEQDLGIDSLPRTKPTNARELCPAELHWRNGHFQELVVATAGWMHWTTDQMYAHINQLIDEWQEEYAADSPELLGNDDFMVFICGRIRTVLAKILADVNDDTNKAAFRARVRKELRQYLFSMSTYTSYQYKFLSHE